MIRRDAAQPLWTPSAERVEATALARYTRWVEERLGVRLPSYTALWEWSVSDIECFWSSIWAYFEVPGGYDRVLGSETMPGAEWFPGSTVNYADYLFAGKDDAGVAILHAGELTDGLQTVTWAELRSMTASIAAGLRALGVGSGDRVVGYVPNIPAAVASFLACASLGAVWSSCSPDFGRQAVQDRFQQIEPKVLIAVDGYRYGGRDFDRREVVAGLMRGLPTLRATVLLPYLDPVATLAGTVPWADFQGFADAELDCAALAFDHPLWVLYSSGTTGLPKGLVHGHGGILLEQLKHHHLHLDARADDRILWFTTTGWMMWNYLVGCLLTDASIVLFDGNPGHPTPGALWDLVADAGVTCFGTSAAFIGGCMEAAIEPNAGRALPRLRSIGSTGSPLAPDAFEWIYENLRSDTWLFSTSGGTDLCTAFVGGVPTLPVYAGELQGPMLGAKIESFDPEGRSLIGETGELVITRPMPSMPLRLWNDADGRRMHETYFSMFDGIWRHGDWIEITERGTAIISGRSDSTINRGGVRMGTAEIYRVLLSMDEVLDALVVDVNGWMPLFVVLAQGCELDKALQRSIVKRVREGCSPRHAPDAVYEIEAVPRTISGKALEVPVKRILQGVPASSAASRDSLANPAALDWFSEFAAELSSTASRA
jgi:acetoacetyl-CoA synthetase